MLKIAFCIVVIFSVTQAQEERCVSPPFLQARAYSYDHETGYYRDGRFSYDAQGQRVRMIERIDENATRPQVDELVLHQIKKRYRIDLKTRKCTEYPVDFHFHRIEVPEGARMVGDSVIGLVAAPDEGLRLRTWEQRVDDRETGVMGNLTVSFTQQECVPVTETFYGYNTKSKQELHFHRTYFDVTLGLDDPNVFEVPMECMQK